MKADGTDEAVIEFLTEPLFVLRRDGRILKANAAARRLLGTDPRAGSLFDHLDSPREEFEDFLKRCSGTTSPLMGALSLKAGNDSLRMRVSGARLRDGGTVPRIALRCVPERDDEFPVLAARVRDLNLQLRKRLHEKAVLEEALTKNRILLRELQHRVKNNIQMMMSLVYMSARGKDTPEVREVLDIARLRLQAMASTQEAIYRSERTVTVPARAFLENLVAAIREGITPSARIEVQIEDAELPHQIAHALALITNELVINAIKHGLNGREDSIGVTFGRRGDEMCLTVRDSGPGMDPEAVSRSSGLRLVRGLCRQIGGALKIENANGARCTVRFSEGR